MSNSDIFGSVLTDFLIMTCGALGVVLASGNAISGRAIAAATCAGVVAAAKEYRQLKKLPPIGENK